jgi:hypothetical protein
LDAADKLSQYHADVLSQGGDAPLPQHLPDHWLDHLLTEGNAYLDQQESVSMSTLLLTVLALVDDQQGGASASSGVITLPLHELNEYLTVYVLSLGIETVSRRTDISGEAPTLESLFDRDRVVRFSRTDRRPGPCRGATV